MSISVPAIVLLLGLTAVASAQGDEAAAIKTFQREFKPQGRALETRKAVMSVSTESGPYKEELARRAALTRTWTDAVRGLRGFGSPAVAKAVADGWARVAREVAPLESKYEGFEKRIATAYAKVTKLSGGEPLLPGKRYPQKLVAAQQVWLMINRQQSETRRDITDLTSLQDELRQVVTAMKDPTGLTWLIENAVGNKRYGLSLKVAALRASAALGESMLPVLTTALDRADKPDVLAACIFGIANLGDKAKSATPKLIALLDHSDGGVREQAALALQHMKAPESIGPLVTLLAKERGHAQLRIAAVLEILTGQQHGRNVPAWQRWFAKEGADYTAGKKPLGLGRPSAHSEQDKKNYYYGIPQDGKSFVYIIDCSGSMVVDKDNPKFGDPGKGRDPVPANDKANSRSESSKRELILALSALSSDKRFNIIWYNHKATLFKKTMVDATPANIEAAKKFVRGLPADSSTNIYEALELAFTLTGRGSYDKHYGVDFDTIFLMTDGKPTLQGVGDDDPNKIIEGARKWNPLKRVVIHTIAMGESGIDHEFMSKLARENGGQYRKILAGGRVVDGSKDVGEGGGKK
ncbi:MAG: HEAT repeat domain-containing protein [Planctomycetes bacterium]|nr:HEAT repeat domain-containing protein [Planctomycetota bacterium]